MDNVTQAYDAQVVEDGERAVVATINTAAVDRYRTVIDPAGVDLKAYNANRVVLWNHGFGNEGRPIGVNKWIRYDKGKRALIAKTVFHEDDFSASIFKLYQAGALRAFSVNVIPDETECSPPTSREVKLRPELADCRFMYRKTELAEYSAVAVPGNAEALTIAVSRGIALPESLRRDLGSAAPLSLPIPSVTLTGRSLDQATRAVIDIQRRFVERSAQDRLDLLRGRV